MMNEATKPQPAAEDNTFATKEEPNTDTATAENDAKRKKPSDGTEEDKPDENNDPIDDNYQPLKRRRKIEPRGVPWFVMLERLKSYKERYGTLNVPSNYRQDPKLASWVQYQRYLFHHKEIAEERKQALEALGFEWSILKPKSGGKKRTWDEQLALVKAYKEANGHTLIPYSYQEDPSLGFWVSKQRKDYKHGQLSQEKISKLENIGFTWNPPTGRRQGSKKKKKTEENDSGSNRQSSWEKMFEKLKQFQEIHGSEKAHSRSDLNAIDKTLATWIKTQRHMYTIKKMSQSRIAKLESIGFAWRVGQDWKDFFARLKDYRDRHGTCDFPAGDDPRLAAWVDSQRVSYKYRELSKERVDKLKSIGFSFEIDEGLEALEASAPPVDDSGLSASLPALTDGSQREKTQPSLAQGLNKRASKEESHQGDATTKLSEYNIAMHLAGLADKGKGDEGRPPSTRDEVEEDGGAKIVLVDGMGAAGNRTEKAKAGDTTEDGKASCQQKEATTLEHAKTGTEEELLLLQEEICELQAEKVRLQEEKVLVQQEKLWLHQEIAALQARKSELTQKVAEDGKDKEAIASAEAGGEDEGDDKKEIADLQDQSKLNEEQLSKQANQIQQQEEKIKKLEEDLQRGE